MSDSLEELLELGEEVPKDSGETEIRLMATAGLRLLDVELQDIFWRSAGRCLGCLGLSFTMNGRRLLQALMRESMLGLLQTMHWVLLEVSSGYHWNYELGGASAQVTFVQMSLFLLRSHPIKFGNFTYNLYSHSFLHFGQNVAHEPLKVSEPSFETYRVPESVTVKEGLAPLNCPFEWKRTRGLSRTAVAAVSGRGRGNTCLRHVRADTIFLEKILKKQMQYHQLLRTWTIATNLENRNANFDYRNEFGKSQRELGKSQRELRLSQRELGLSQRIWKIATRTSTITT
ncbi:hypothetical protein F3Y22_tig00116995pilonHSYRG00089 [Hibiscus syriacus]|uniref:apyrase n=1 Tax=Hibiscus syriacus TaxID=106335 RepID=A0A6A2XG45_HIBSY|nr:hypothetical protein F3Y22_tig00116995pilonHSYRG00089 [Hibiscus syriacus]